MNRKSFLNLTARAGLFLGFTPSLIGCKSQDVIEWCLVNKSNIPDIGFTEPAKAMPDEYKVDDVVKSYRNYYRGGKSGFATWKNREVPKWFLG